MGRRNLQKGEENHEAAQGDDNSATHLLCFHSISGQVLHSCQGGGQSVLFFQPWPRASDSLGLAILVGASRAFVGL